MRQLLLISSLLLILPQTGFAQDFKSFELILQKHLSEKTLSNGGFETHFNYQKAFDDPKAQAAFQKQKKVLGAFDPSQLKSKEQANAFWINAYNFFMLNVIIEKGFSKGKLNINSVKDFGSFFNPYKIFKQKIHSIGGTKYSLDQIEKETLLGASFKKKNWKDARIHFAVNCASVGCPPLIKEIYTAENLNQKLNDNIKKAFKTKRHFEIKGKNLSLTHLFKWYKKDFEEHSGSVKQFLKSFSEPAVQEKIDQTNGIDFIEYNWNLNKPENF